MFSFFFFFLNVFIYLTIFFATYSPADQIEVTKDHCILCTQIRHIVGFNSQLQKKRTYFLRQTPPLQNVTKDPGCL